MPIELTLRNDGAEISGNLQLPEAPSSPRSKEGIVPAPPMFVYIVPWERSADKSIERRFTRTGHLLRNKLLRALIASWRSITSGRSCWNLGSRIRN